MNHNHPLQSLPAFQYEETPEERYRRLKAISDATGKRLLFVYREDEGRRNAMKTKGVS